MLLAGSTTEAVMQVDSRYITYGQHTVGHLGLATAIVVAAVTWKVTTQDMMRTSARRTRYRGSPGESLTSQVSGGV